MKKLILENFRCFRTRQEVPLAPLTLLVGENSTGKSSFLAATRIAWSIGHKGQMPDFNEDPFLLGTYEQIAYYQGESTERARFFTIGYEDSKKTGIVFRDDFRVQAMFLQGGVQPHLHNWTMVSSNYRIVISDIYKQEGTNFRIETPQGPLSWETQLPTDQTIPLDYLKMYLTILGLNWKAENGQDSKTEVMQSEIQQVSFLLDRIDFSPLNRPYAVAPIRTKPKRTYDPVQDIPKPEGEHIPMVLARIVSNESKEWLAMKKSLEDFGRVCGLYDEIEVRKLEDSTGSPFQIRVKINALATNLVDVGYGVSQVIPILVDSFRAAPGQILLLQQPEVHLHPRAQAELGTFLANLVKHDQKQFIVETHSDYLVDRVCMDVRDGKTLKPEDVLILFFERMDSEVIIHPITVDKNGNIENAPASYRSFFLKEEQRYLGL